VVNNNRDPLLTVDEAGELLGTGPRFARRLIAERRIRYVKIGRYVRIPESALIEFVDSSTVQPVAVRVRWRNGRAS
jgi:excisionase family DNA binding protein